MLGGVEACAQGSVLAVLPDVLAREHPAGLRRLEAIAIEEVADDPQLSLLARGDRYDAGACAIAPVAVGGEVLGLLCAADRAGGARFAEDDLVLLRLPVILLTQFSA